MADSIQQALTEAFLDAGLISEEEAAQDAPWREMPTEEEFREQIDNLGTEEEVPMTFGLVEMLADEDDCAWDQECAYGHRVEQHAVYCHNPDPDMPRKCRMGWYTGGRRPDCMCIGFKPQPGKPYPNAGAYI